MYIFIGPPSCGKGTQARLLAQKLGMSHISLGDLLREEVEKGVSENSQKIRDLINNGNLVDDELVFSLVKGRIKKGEPIIIDGYPRTKGQAQLLDMHLEAINYGPYKVFKFDVPFDELYDRVINRIVCMNCGEIYNKLTCAPKVSGVCDKCGGVEFEVRADDRVDILKKRIVNYEKQIEPIINLYEEKGVMYNVNAHLSIDAVNNQILSYME